MINLDHGYIGAPIAGAFVIDSITNFTDEQMSSEKSRMNFSIRVHPKKFQKMVQKPLQSFPLIVTLRPFFAKKKLKPVFQNLTVERHL